MVTDSRGNTTTETVEVEALAYAPPTITEASVYRCDDALLAADDGVHIAAKATAGCTSLGGANSVTLKAAYKAADAASYGTEVTLQSGVAGNGDRQRGHIHHAELYGAPDRYGQTGQQHRI